MLPGSPGRAFLAWQSHQRAEASTSNSNKHLGIDISSPKSFPAARNYTPKIGVITEETASDDVVPVEMEALSLD